jgi:xylulose-5-phosphate/fructose-6-phosphate phosphoketolase
MLFTTNKPVIFNFHGYASLVHELTYRRHNNRLMHVRGYKEEGTITTPFDVRVQNDIDRFHLVQDALELLPQLGNRGAYLYQKMSDRWWSTSSTSLSTARISRRLRSGDGVNNPRSNPE